MPGRNVYKEYVVESYYHIYNRGVNKADIFLDDKDYTVFLSLLKRYLGADIEKRPNRELRPNYQKQIELLAFCLMNNHFHLFIYQQPAEAIKDFMKSLSISYSMYFNNRYKRIGPLFQQRYKAIRITDDSQLLHLTRYIHMNPKGYQDYEWSSINFYLGRKQASWMRPQRVLELFDGQDYAKFLDEYKEKRQELKDLKNELADA